ncbi:MAG: hypothetical protein ACXABG_11690, partial [Promethearchaeota archaeon]
MSIPNTLQKARISLAIFLLIITNTSQSQFQNLDSKGFDYRIEISNLDIGESNMFMYGFEELKDREIELIADNMRIPLKTFALVWQKNNSARSRPLFWEQLHADSDEWICKPDKRGISTNEVYIYVGLIGVTIKEKSLLLSSSLNEPKNISQIFKSLYIDQKIVNKENSIPQNLDLIVVKNGKSQNTKLRAGILEKSLNTTNYKSLVFFLWNRDTEKKLPQILTYAPEHFARIPVSSSPTFQVSAQNMDLLDITIKLAQVNPREKEKIDPEFNLFKEEIYKNIHYSSARENFQIDKIEGGKRIRVDRDLWESFDIKKPTLSSELNDLVTLDSYHKSAVENTLQINLILNKKKFLFVTRGISWKTFLEKNKKKPEEIPGDKVDLKIFLGSYCLNDLVLDTLKSSGISENILNKLNDIKNKEFISRNAITGALSEIISPQLYTNYENLFGIEFLPINYTTAITHDDFEVEIVDSPDIQYKTLFVSEFYEASTIAASGREYINSIEVNNDGIECIERTLQLEKANIQFTPKAECNSDDNLLPRRFNIGRLGSSRTITETIENINNNHFTCELPLRLSLIEVDEQDWQLHVTEEDGERKLVSEYLVRETGSHELMLERKTSSRNVTIQFEGRSLSDDAPEFGYEIKVRCETPVYGSVNFSNFKVLKKNSVINWPVNPHSVDSIILSLTLPRGYYAEKEQTKYMKNSIADLILSYEDENIVSIKALQTIPVIFYDLTQDPINQDSVYNWVNDFVKKKRTPFFYISNG